MKKKILAALLAALMLICAVSVGALSSDEVIVLDSTNGYTLDVELFLYGDAQLDGDVDMDDVIGLLRHVSEMQEITDERALECVEVTKDTTISMEDVIKLLRYVSEMTDSLE